jgi:hypothetical protein
MKFPREVRLDDEGGVMRLGSTADVDRVCRALNVATAVLEEIGAFDKGVAGDRATSTLKDLGVWSERVERVPTAMEQAMESSKRAHMTLRAVEDASLTYDGPLVVPVEVYRGYDMYFLVAIGEDGTGLYRHTPKRSHRYQGKVHAVRVEQAQSHGVEPPTSSYRKLVEAGLMEWQ